jgi:predicted TIM-barrel fold metal-dependent hydrolase
MDRRKFLGVAAAAALMSAAARRASVPCIDTHIHLFDPRRPQGIPWPTKKDGILYQPALPDRYRKQAESFGVVGAIEVECSPWLEDNQWVLDVLAKNPIMVGTVGNIDPSSAGFAQQLDRFHKNPLFLGIRCGNLWDKNLADQVSSPEFISRIKALADAGLEMDTANQTPALLAAALRLSDRVPNLRIVIDHLPQLTFPQEQAARQALQSDLRELGRRPQIFTKLSEVLRNVSGKVPVDLSYYRATLDEIWDIFGEDRVMYGSDWPNSDQWAPYATGFGLIREYISTKSPQAQEKFFWKNSIAAYRWVPRDRKQPR